MSALGHQRTFLRSVAMSALPLKADIGSRLEHRGVRAKSGLMHCRKVFLFEPQSRIRKAMADFQGCVGLSASGPNNP